MSAALTNLPPLDQTQLHSSYRPLINTNSPSDNHLPVWSSTISLFGAHSPKERIRKYQLILTTQLFTYCTRKFSTVISKSLYPTVIGRPLMGRHSGGCNNYFHLCITSHLHCSLGFEEYIRICRSCTKHVVQCRPVLNGRNPGGCDNYIHQYITLQLTPVSILCQEHWQL